MTRRDCRQLGSWTLTSKSNKTKHTGSQMYLGLRTAVKASVLSAQLLCVTLARTSATFRHFMFQRLYRRMRVRLIWVDNVTVKSILLRIPRHWIKNRYQKQSVNDSLKHHFSNCRSRHHRGSWNTLLKNYLKYSYIHVVLIRFSIRGFIKRTCNEKLHTILLMWLYRDISYLTVGCKAIWVPAVTVQTDRDLQQCAELHFSWLYRNIL
jgi:hypothetical protein